MLDLIAPTGRLHTAWLEAQDEWGPGLHEDGFGLLASDEVDSPDGFAAWVARLADDSDPGKPVEAGRVRCTYRWIVEGEQVLGGIALRHQLNDSTMEIGHIGYGIRPSARRRGLATCQLNHDRRWVWLFWRGRRDSLRCQAGPHGKVSEPGDAGVAHETGVTGL